VAVQARYRLSFKNEDCERWYEASRIGFEQVNHKPMIELVTDCLKREYQLEQQRTDNKRKSLSDRLDKIKRKREYGENRHHQKIE